jgi:hypothetical protein
LSHSLVILETLVHALIINTWFAMAGYQVTRLTK